MLKLLTRAAIAIFVIGILMINTSGVEAQQGSQGGTLTVMSAPIPNLDPMAPTQSSGDIVGQVFASLTRLDADWTPQPYMARSWEASKDGLKITFHLDPNAKFHDGQPVTSDDIAFSLEIVKKYHRFGQQMFGSVEGVETPDQLTAVFRLSEPSGGVLLSTSVARFMPILPKHIYGDGQEYTTHPAHTDPVGSGPFKIKEVSLPEFVELERFDDYYRKGLPYLDRIIYRVVRDSTSVRIGLGKGDFDLAVASLTTPYRDLNRIREIGHLAVDECCFANGAILTLDINNRRPPLDDKRVRKAISLAIDYEFMVKNLHDGWTRQAIGPIVSASPFADKEAGPLPTDIEEANRLLDEAGLPVKADGTRFEISVLHESQFRDLFVSVPEYLVPALRRVGIKLRREQMPDSPSWSKRMADWDYDVAMTLPGNFVDPTIGVSRLYLCDNIKHVAYTNTSGYCNESVDELFEKASKETDTEKRKQLYIEVQRMVKEDMPIIWLLETPYPLVYDKKLANVPLSAWGPSGPLDELYWASPKSE